MNPYLGYVIFLTFKNEPYLSSFSQQCQTLIYIRNPASLNFSNSSLYGQKQLQAMAKNLTKYLILECNFQSNYSKKEQIPPKVSVKIM